MPGECNVRAGTLQLMFLKCLKIRLTIASLWLLACRRRIVFLCDYVRQGRTFPSCPIQKIPYIHSKWIQFLNADRRIFTSPSPSPKCVPTGAVQVGTGYYFQHIELQGTFFSALIWHWFTHLQLQFAKFLFQPADKVKRQYIFGCTWTCYTRAVGVDSQQVVPWTFSNPALLLDVQ